MIDGTQVVYPDPHRSLSSSKVQVPQAEDLKPIERQAFPRCPIGAMNDDRRELLNHGIFWINPLDNNRSRFHTNPTVFLTDTLTDPSIPRSLVRIMARLIRLVLLSLASAYTWIDGLLDRIR